MWRTATHGKHAARWSWALGATLSIACGSATTNGDAISGTTDAAAADVSDGATDSAGTVAEVQGDVASAEVAMSDVPMSDAAAEVVATDAGSSDLGVTDAGPAADGGPADAGTDANDVVADAGPGADGASNDLGAQDIGTGCCANCGAGQVCVDGKDCLPIAKPGACWTDADCGGLPCVGAFVCPCTADCDAASTPGVCADKDPDCCTDGPCTGGKTCTAGKACKSDAQLGAGQCWSDANCPSGSACVGANVCPCGAMCLVADKPGQCQASSGCTKVDPSSFGMCDMIVGWVWNGSACVSASGCGCGSQCAAVFADEASCKAKCP